VTGLKPAVLARLAEKYDYEQIVQGRLTNDALIAMSPGRLGIRVFTANERDYRRLAESLGLVVFGSLGLVVCLILWLNLSNLVKIAGASWACLGILLWWCAQTP
jgi:hypothetical protein